jgi:hypothetical protein
MIWFIFSLIIHAKSELLSYEIALKSPIYFDDQYKIFSRNNPAEQIYGYDKDHACLMRKNERCLKVYIQNVRTLEKSAEISFETDRMQTPIYLINCFKYKGNSFVIYNQGKNEETTIIRGNNEIRKLKNFKYDAIRFDHINEKLYLTQGHIIYNIEMDYFENIWNPKNISHHGLLKINSVSMLDNTITDFQIFKNYIYLIKEFIIYKSKVGAKEIVMINNSSSTKFNFVLFENFNKVVYADSSKILLTILYLIDVIVIMIFIYFFKNTKLKQINRYEGVPIEMEIFNKK